MQFIQTQEEDKEKLFTIIEGLLMFTRAYEFYCIYTFKITHTLHFALRE
jgi:hypothetical protein